MVIPEFFSFWILYALIWLRIVCTIRSAPPLLWWLYRCDCCWMISQGGFSIIAPFDCNMRITASDAGSPSDCRTFECSNSDNHERFDETMYGSPLPLIKNGGCPSGACAHVCSDHEVEVWLSLLRAGYCVIKLNHWKDFRSCPSMKVISVFLTEYRYRTMASRGRATGCVSQCRPYYAHVVLVAMLPEGSQVRCILHLLLVQKLLGAVNPSRSLHLFVVELQHDVLQVLWRFHWSRQFALRFLLLSSCHRVPPFLVNVAQRSSPLAQNLPTLMMGPLTSHTWNVIQTLRPSRSFIDSACWP